MPNPSGLPLFRAVEGPEEILQTLPCGLSSVSRFCPAIENVSPLATATGKQGVHMN